MFFYVVTYCFLQKYIFHIKQLQIVLHVKSLWSVWGMVGHENQDALEQQQNAAHFILSRKSKKAERRGALQ